MSVDAPSLLRWYAAQARDLPWRRDGVTGWQILMSEVMLQQTPVARVAPIWEEWVRRWPVPSAMAASSQAEVLRAWGKLGYPRRALRLHECAGVLAAEHDDRVPEDVDVLLTLPGVGAYTARAVACFAYGQRVPVVDTNVRRVVARAVHGRAEPGNPSTTRDLADVESLLPRTRARAATFSAALMELGATRATGVCWSITSDMRICHPVTPSRRHGRSRASDVYQRTRAVASTLISHVLLSGCRRVVPRR